MSTPNNKLLFFDKEGYPYNLTYNEDINEWSGKIFFDENSSDTFRTICLYIFESVSPYEFSDTFDVRSSQLFNYSGMTFNPQTLNTNEEIWDIKKVNNSSYFYSKWIYGDRFDKKFPVGSTIFFNNLTGYTNSMTEDPTFSLTGVSGNTYYNVVGSKKDAFLITTYTNNRDFDFIFSGGTVSSANIIEVPDYGEQKLVDLTNLNYYPGKKLSVYGSNNNNGIYTYKDYDVLKTKLYDFELPDMMYDTGYTLNIDFYLMTQRPELYEGNISITYNDLSSTGTTIEFANYINTNIDFTTTGQTIIFELPDGSPIHSSDPEFTITGFVDRDLITTGELKFYMNQDVNVIEFQSGTTFENLKYGDYIELIAYPFIDNGTKHDRRQFQVVNIENNILQVREYIIQESGFTYEISKVINKRKINKLYCSQNAVITPSFFSGYTICQSISNKINLNQSIILSGDTTYFYENTITAMRNKYRTLLNRYGLNIYHYNYENKNYLIFDGLDYNYQPYYSGATASIIDSNQNISPLIVGNNFTYLNTGSTIQDSDVFYFVVDEKINNYEKINHYDYNKLAKNYSVEIYFNIERDSTNYGFNLILNNVDYFIPISGSTGNYTINTINSFINTYYNIFDKAGITISSGETFDIYTGYTLKVESQQPNIIFYDISVKVNIFSKYDIIKNDGNRSVVIDSSELYLVDTNKSLYDYELATGMIIDVTGFTHTINNKQFNILRLTDNIIQLSYQGPLLYEYASNLILSINSFLRTPRGGYDRTIKYKFKWDPIEENNPKVSPDIFYYDYSGSQLKSNGELTYIGQIPLWSSDLNNNIFLNREPNKILDKIRDPEYQQTIFDELVYDLENMNSSIGYNYVPSPLQVFIGFNSKIEGVSQNNLVIEKIDEVLFTGTTSNISGSTTYINNFILYSGETESYIEYQTNEPFFSFSKIGFEPEHHITISFAERVLTGQTIYTGYEKYRIKDVTDKKITIFDKINSFDTSYNDKTYNFILKTEPDRVAFINLYGQTEIEDTRFNQHLKLLGASLESEVQPLFKESDINEVGIDYTILNRKRKELLTIYPEIYNYIGSYKALINAINFFGYNDLELYEYYRCIKKNSPLYGKLHKVIIEDIFDNTIPGWQEPEMDHNNYIKTNLFNLTYKITDSEGNYIDMYSLDEVQRKLIGMVKWLRKNIIPLSSNIMDITGVANTVGTMYINYNAANYAKKITTNLTNAAINFNHIQTLNIDTNYLFTINFYLTSGTTMPDYWTAKIKTFHLNEQTRELEPVQYIELYKNDLLSYSFNVDSVIEPYMYIETQSFNDYGLGYTNNKLFNYNEGRNFILINNNFTGVNYKYLTDNYGYYIIADGRFYIIGY